MKLYNCDTGWTILPAHMYMIWSLNANKKIYHGNIFSFFVCTTFAKLKNIVREKRTSVKSIPLRCTCVFLYGAKIFAPRLKINIECKHKKKSVQKQWILIGLILRARNVWMFARSFFFKFFYEARFSRAKCDDDVVTARRRILADGACLCEIRCKYVSTCTARLRICEWISKSLHSSI